jgi:hypothetical protein
VYAKDDGRGRLSGDTNIKSDLTVLNWLWRYMKCSPTIFTCPSSRNRITGPPVIDKSNGESYYNELIGTAKDRFDRLGCSYDMFRFFADRENLWNGNFNYANNSRRVLKTLSLLDTYQHLHEAFNLKGTKPGPDKIWLFSDADSTVITRCIYPDEENNHGIDGFNVAFTDGHVVWVKRDQIVYSYEQSQDNNRTRPYPRR